MDGQFSGKHLSMTARRAARLLGLETVKSFDAISQHKLLNEDDPGGDTVVIRAYGTRGQMADITARDMYYAKTVEQDTPPARV